MGTITRPYALLLVVGAVVLVSTGASGCRSAEEPSAPAAAKTDSPAPAAAPSTPATSSREPSDLGDSLGLRGGLPVPDGLIPGGDCPPPAPDAEQEMAAQAQAAVPLKVGLTFAYTWTRAQDEYECLIQVTKIDAGGIDTTMSCDYPPRRGPFTRRVCRADLRNASMLHTAYGAVKVIGASGEEEPETITGATAFTLSTSQFALLKRTGVIPHHYVELGSTGRLDKEGIGELRLVGRETIQVIVNDRVMDIPVLETTGTMKWWIRGEHLDTQDKVVILDDERFPLLIDQTSNKETAELGIQFAKITYPGGGKRASSAGGDPLAGGGGSLEGAFRGSSLEEGLVENKRVDVYGIYFDFNSDHIRPESEPVLAEIGSILQRHPDWQLHVDGHTDSIGGNGEYNLALSRRRSAAVRAALVNRFGISADRLVTGGYGAAVPKDTNDTPKGRARNRRVELSRL